MRRIAAAYGVSYDGFLHHALGRAGRGARYLDDASDETLARLSVGTGVPLAQLRDMSTGATLARVSQRIQDWLQTPEGREALDQVRVSLGRMMRRADARSREETLRDEISGRAGLRSIDSGTG